MRQSPEDVLQKKEHLVGENQNVADVDEKPQDDTGNEVISIHYNSYLLL